MLYFSRKKIPSLWLITAHRVHKKLENLKCKVIKYLELSLLLNSIGWLRDNEQHTKCTEIRKDAHKAGIFTLINGSKICCSHGSNRTITLACIILNRWWRKICCSHGSNSTTSLAYILLNRWWQLKYEHVHDRLEDCIIKFQAASSQMEQIKVKVVNFPADNIIHNCRALQNRC